MTSACTQTCPVTDNFSASGHSFWIRTIETQLTQRRVGFTSSACLTPFPRTTTASAFSGSQTGSQDPSRVTCMYCYSASC